MQSRTAGADTEPGPETSSRPKPRNLTPRISLAEASIWCTALGEDHNKGSPSVYVEDPPGLLFVLPYTIVQILRNITLSISIYIGSKPPGFRFNGPQSLHVKVW